jgi:uncharacterized protein YbaP (TraB family)
MADAIPACSRITAGRAVALTAAVLAGVLFAASAQAGEAEAASPRTQLQPAAPASQPQSWRSGDDERAEQPSGSPPVLRAAECVGVDLVKALQSSDAASFEKFESSARAVANGQGLLWRIEGKSGRASYLFGTMHSSESIAKSFDELVLRALRRARVVATELPGASTRKVANELRRLVANRSFRPEGDSLGALPSGVRERVEARIAKIGIPPSVAEQLQPWYLALALSRSRCSGGQAGVDPETADARIERFAVEQGSALVALESPGEQVDALASIPDEVALRMMREATERDLRPEDVESTITGLYSTRRIGYLLAMRGPIWAGVFDVDGYADFLNAFITRRNAAMLQRALPILSAGDAFLAVGALHLPGEGGLVELIRKAGYSVTRIW